MTIATDLQEEFYDMVSDDTFGETIEYIADGVTYSILAHVYRKGITSTPQRFDRGTASKPLRYDVEVRISTHATQGRATVRIKENYVRVAKDVGGPVLNMRVAEIIDQDPGTWRLGLSV
jgi:hypothetical protein